MVDNVRLMLIWNKSRVHEWYMYIDARWWMDAEPETSNQSNLQLRVY
jgi:hypothetical protein